MGQKVKIKITKTQVRKTSPSAQYKKMSTMQRTGKSQKGVADESRRFRQEPYRVGKSD